MKKTLDTSAAERSRGRRSRVGARALAAVGAAATLALTACGGSGSDSAAGAGDDGKNVTLISCTNSNPWCNGFNKGLEEQLGQEGVQVTTQTSDFDAAEASRQFAQAVSQRPDLILYYVNDPNAAVADYQKAQQAGVPVVVVDTVVGDESDGLIAAALQPDHEALGTFAAENIQEGLKAQGVTEGNVIAITGTATQNTTVVRMNAFREQMATTPEYTIVETQDGDWDPVKSATIASQMFAKYGPTGIAAIYGMADYQAASIAQAAEQAGAPLYPASDEGVVITGSNCATTGIDAMRAEKVYGGATQAPAQEAEQYTPYIMQVLNGESLDSDGPISVPVERITYTTVEDFADICVY
ncbi:sugar ABC transporter substrate-binding protein [Gordonia mangrovi]|uniref:sugar ABC transporter substrate-binding protein n=1 Tax=Gordonia mangrovi TaxID=2665643 RepID=UPI0013686F6A|nr:sugar ABC transporter substrate-binding protein [Gordonia mangrovi]UVF80511.1 sugar ABC transporter substrate-binding protein [Gordonia mangrovi]